MSDTKAQTAKKYLGAEGTNAIAQGIANAAPKTWRFYPDDESTLEEIPENAEEGVIFGLGFPTPQAIKENLDNIRVGDSVDATDLIFGTEYKRDPRTKLLLQIIAAHVGITGDFGDAKYNYQIVATMPIANLGLYYVEINYSYCSIVVGAYPGYDDTTKPSTPKSSTGTADWLKGFVPDWGEEQFGDHSTWWYIGQNQREFSVGDPVQIYTSAGSNTSTLDTTTAVVIGVSETDGKKYAVASGVASYLAPGSDTEYKTSPGLFVFRLHQDNDTLKLYAVSFYPLLRLWKDIYEQKDKVQTLEQSLQKYINRTVELGFPALWMKAGGLMAVADDNSLSWQLAEVDLTAEEAMEIYDLGHIHYGNAAYYYAGTNIKATLPIRSHVPVNCEGTFMDCVNLQKVTDANLIPWGKCFKGCTSLTNIVCHSPVGDKGNGSLDAYEGCTLLETITFDKVYASDINFKDCPSLSATVFARLAELYDEGTSITVTVHGDVLAKLTETTNTDYYTAFQACLAKNISFATE